MIRKFMDAIDDILSGLVDYESDFICDEMSGMEDEQGNCWCNKNCKYDCPQKKCYLRYLEVMKDDNNEQ